MQEQGHARQMKVLRIQLLLIYISMRFSAQSAKDLLLCGYYSLSMQVTHERDYKNITNVFRLQVNHLAVYNKYLKKTAEDNLNESVAHLKLSARGSTNSTLTLIPLP